MEHHKTFENFRFDGQIDLHRLHRHSLSLMRFISSIIEQRDPALFQAALNDNISLHRHAHVNLDYMSYLIMEYADGGSLSYFLHREPRLEYSLNHVINWTLQIAKVSNCFA